MENMNLFTVSFSVAEALSNHEFWSRLDEFLLQNNIREYQAISSHQTMVKNIIVAFSTLDHYFQFVAAIDDIRIKSSSKVLRMFVIFKEAEELYLYKLHSGRLRLVTHHNLTAANLECISPVCAMWLYCPFDGIEQALKDAASSY